MAANEHFLPGEAEPCGCLGESNHALVINQDLGLDDLFAEVSTLHCPVCGQLWLKYFYEVEAFTASGRWYLGPIATQQALNINAGNARATLENLAWYFYGGSYFGGRTGKASGLLHLGP